MPFRKTKMNQQEIILPEIEEEVKLEPALVYGHLESVSIMSNDLFLANNRLSASYSYANDEESIMRPCKRKTSKKRKDAQRISTKLAVLDPPNDYNKNICGYISKKIAKEYISVANKDLVETICSTFGSQYNFSVEFYRRNIENLSGPRNIVNFLVTSNEKLQAQLSAELSTNFAFNSTDSSENSPIQEKLDNTGSSNDSFSRLLVQLEPLEITQILRSKLSFTVFYVWYLHNHYLKLLLTEGKMLLKKEYISYKNTKLLGMFHSDLPIWSFVDHLKRNVKL